MTRARPDSRPYTPPRRIRKNRYTDGKSAARAPLRKRASKYGGNLDGGLLISAGFRSTLFHAYHSEVTNIPMINQLYKNGTSIVLNKFDRRISDSCNNVK